MDIDFSRDDVANWLKEVCVCELEENEASYLFNLGKQSVTESLPIDKTAIDSIIDSLRKKEIQDETTLITDTTYEVTVQVEGRYTGIMRIQDDFNPLRDEDSGLTYKLTPISDEYLIFLLWKMSHFRSTRTYSRSLQIDRYLQENADDMSILNLAKRLIQRYPSLKVEADSKTSYKRLRDLANSFLFQLGFNTDTALVPKRFFEELTRGARISVMRRAKANELDPPRRIYNEDLIHHYLLGVSTDNPVIEYLSYYHVAEHFFEAVFQDELINKVKNYITKPNFSYKRKKDISELIKIISNSLRIRSDEMVFNEQEALRLTLIRHVQLPDLKVEIETYNNELVQYYQDNIVSFSGGEKVDLSAIDQEEAYRLLSKRIYKTRNSLVHSKESEKKKYVPFNDDRILIKEVPLMRFIAESIILSESTLIS